MDKNNPNLDDLTNINNINEVYKAFMPSKKGLLVLKILAVLLIFPVPWIVAIALLFVTHFNGWVWVDILFWILPFITGAATFIYAKEVYFKNIQNKLGIDSQGMMDFAEQFKQKYQQGNGSPFNASENDLNHDNKKQEAKISPDDIQEAKIIDPEEPKERKNAKNK